MGACDHSEELTVGSVGERMGQCSVEPALSLDNGSGTSPVGNVGEGLVLPLEDEELNTGLETLNGDLNSRGTSDFGCGEAGENRDLGNMSSIELGIDRMCFDETICNSDANPCPSDQMACSSQGVEPVSNANSCSQTLPGGKEHCCSESDGELGPRDDHNFGVTLDFGGNNADVSQLENMSVIEIGLSRVHFDMTQSKCEMIPCTSNLMNHSGELDVPSRLEQVGSDHVGKQAERSGRADDDVSKVDCPDASSSSLRRSSRTRKCVQQDQGGKRATKSSKKGSSLSHCGIIDLLSKATRKKRSCLSRSLCSTAWGLPGNLSKYFDCSNEATVNKVLDKVSQRGKGGQRSKKKNTLKVAAAPQISEPVLGFPCRPIRLKVTFGKKAEEKKEGVTPLQAVDSQSIPLSSNDDNKPELCSYTEKDAGNPTCLDTVHLEPSKVVSSHADKYMGPETSPDSEVIDQVVDTSMAHSTPTISLSHNPVNITSEVIVPGNVSSPSKKSGNKKNKKDKLSETSNVGTEDKTIGQDSVDKSKKKKRSKKDKLCEGGKLRADETVLCLGAVGKAKSKKGGRHRLSTAFCFKDTGMDASNENPLSNIELTSAEPLLISEKLPNKAPSLDNGADNNAYSHIVSGIEADDTGNISLSLSPDGVEGKRILEGSKAKGKSKSKSKATDATKKQREPSGQLKENKRKGKSKSRQKEENDSLVQANDKGSQSQTGKYDMLDVRKTQTDNGVVLENVSCMDVLPAEGGERTMPSAWVCCDDCLKWRCIPAKLADTIEETHCKWTCKDNQDKAFADCSIPQEKSNAEINAELQISDEEDGRDGHLGSKGGGIRHAIDSQPSTWMLIKSNLFLHRNRKTQTMDEIMVCHCKPPAEGSLGCGNQCLNRMLNIECVQGTCPCGDLCSNQQFQKRQYAKLSWFRCGKKGYGLQASEDISNGQFLIEYVGEVLDLQAYEARQKDYASKGYKHFYFMTLNGNEVIDACAKGNLGRFVNHSCDPNCRTEKWVVNGEICVGLFALKNIKKGEELTFDYNYVRVFGAAAKKCHCGSSKCRGYIGGDPNNAEVVVQGDSDDEFPEPVVIDENGEIDHTLEGVMAKSRSEDVKLEPSAHDLYLENLEVTMEDANKVNEIDMDGPSPASTKKQEGDEVRQSPHNLAALENVRDEAISSVDQIGSRREHTTSTSISSSTVSDILPVKRVVKNSLSGSSDSTGRISEVDFVECEKSPPKPRPRMKISRPSKAVKDRKSNNNSSNAEKVLFAGHRAQLLSQKPKKLVGGSANGHLEAVEEKLNELLDGDGGICKRKDASKGYLKLLLLTAASGDSGNGGAIQSNRDLSMILDAMLKTKSRGVLLDIINKNGLQMLHNMMKLYRRDFKKIPILRKLLKVLEFLAEREILTVERINEDPLRPGVESFRASILCLTEHDDKKVHQIARNFRDRWIPRPIRKFNGIEKLDRKREFNRISDSNRFLGVHHHRQEHASRPTDSIDCTKNSEVSHTPIDPKVSNTPTDAKVPEPLPAVSTTPTLTQTVTSTIPSQTRKRKSRWDQDKRPRTCSQKPKTSPIAPDRSEGAPSCSGSTMTSELKADDPMQLDDDDDDAPPPGFSCSRISEEDAPPGFSSLQIPKKEPPPPKYPTSVSKGCLQERFNSHLPVSFGIPFSVVQQLGSPESDAVDGWVIAPAIPFQPFPPLPPYPRRDEGVPSTSGSGVVSANVQNPGPTNHQYMVHQERGVFNGPGLGPGKRFNHWKHKWGGNNNNNQGPKFKHPWLKRRNGWGFKGNYPRNGTFMGGGGRGGGGIMGNGHDGPHLVDVNHSVEFARNSC